MKLRYVCFLFALLGVLICVTGCGLLENKQNVVASSQYTVDPIESALIRCDYNEDGALLSRTLIEWDTLQPTRYVGQRKDWTYTYKRGALRSVTVCTAPITLTKQEDGSWYGKGFDVLGGAHSVQYALDESGGVVSEFYTKGQRPYGVETFTYAYDAQGRLISLTKHAVANWGREESVYTYEYTADSVAIFLDGEPYATLCLDGNGMPLSYTRAGNGEPTYTWQYDETGKPVPTSENTRWDYDENGRLTAIYHLDENGEWQTVREYAFDKKGNLTRSVKTTVDESTTTVSTVEFSKGLRTRSTTDYVLANTQGKIFAHNWTENTYDSQGRYDKGVRYNVAEDGTKILSQEISNMWDAQGRYAGYCTRTYSDDKPRFEDSKTYTYDENDQINTMTTGEIDYEEGNRYDHKTTEYYNEDFAKTREYGEIVWLDPDENGDVVRNTSDATYDEKGENVIRLISHSYRNEVLVREAETNYDREFGNGLYSTYHAKEYEDGQMTREYMQTEDEEWGYVSSEQVYVDGVLREDNSETRVRGSYKTENGTTFTRPTQSTHKYYDATGQHERTEEKAYTFYEDGTCQSLDVTVKDAGGKTVERYFEEYDEAGELIARTEK